MEVLIVDIIYAKIKIYQKILSSLNKWLNILKPAFKSVINQNKDISDHQGINNLEKESIKTSINNLINFPFVKNSLDKKELILHGLWHDIGTGELESLNPVSQEFEKI